MTPEYSPLTRFYHHCDSLLLDSGLQLSEFQIVYETYGQLNSEKNNAILVCHALSADAHAGDGGWWDQLIGPGKALDTNVFFVICSNALGSCYGSSGPASINPETGQRFKTSFPLITVGDMVNAQAHLIDHLDVSQLLMVIGGSMGGMQALEWSIRFPDRLLSCVSIASTSKLSPQALAFGTVGRNAIISDANWNEGHYDDHSIPVNGLAIARMIGHITYLSEESMSIKFGRKLQEKEDYGYNLKTDFQIESYLQYQGHKFVSRFDANSYLYLSKAMSYFDIQKSHRSLENAFKLSQARYLIMSITSDWLYPSKDSKEIVNALVRLNKCVTFTEIDSPFGHDGFLLSQTELSKVITPFLKGVFDDQ